MADKTPVKATFTGSNVTGLAEFQSSDTIAIADGGTGLGAVGSAGSRGFNSGEDRRRVCGERVMAGVPAECTMVRGHRIWHVEQRCA